MVVDTRFRHVLARIHPVLLPAWFIGWSAWRLLYLSPNVAPGADARLYTEAARVWLAGGDPWGVSITGFHFANLPATLVAFAPFAILGKDAGAICWIAISAVAALAIVRRLRLPWWWLLFPPLVEGTYVGNPQVLLLALLLAGRGVGEGLAVVLKAYAAIPLVLLGRWRGLGVALALVAATVVVWPATWRLWFESLGGVSGRLADESFGGFSAIWLPSTLIVPTLMGLAALWLLDRRAASWLAVPALWPGSQFFYSTFALPVGSAALAAIMAVPLRGAPPVAVCVYAGIVAWGRRRTTRAAGNTDEPSTSEGIAYRRAELQ